MTTGGSGDNNESTPQEDASFQQEMERIGARVPPGRMGNVMDLATVSLNTPEISDEVYHESILTMM